MSLFTVHRWVVWRGQDSCAWVRFQRRLSGKLGPTIQSCTQVHQTCSRIIIGCRQGTGTQQHADKKGSSCRLSKDSSLRLSGFAGSVLYDWTPKAQHYFVKDIHNPHSLQDSSSVFAKKIDNKPSFLTFPAIFFSGFISSVFVLFCTVEIKMALSRASVIA